MAQFMMDDDEKEKELRRKVLGDMQNSMGEREMKEAVPRFAEAIGEAGQTAEQALKSAMGGQHTEREGQRMLQEGATSDNLRALKEKLGGQFTEREGIKMLEPKSAEKEVSPEQQRALREKFGSQFAEGEAKQLLEPKSAEVEISVTKTGEGEEDEDDSDFMSRLRKMRGR